MSAAFLHRAVGASQVHLTPRWIIDRLGPFDLDPCAATERPWDCAYKNYTEAEDGLSRPWRGRVWLNPPYHRHQVGKWIRRLADHGSGVALVHARVETNWFEPIWACAGHILFMADRVKFCRPNGTEQPKDSGAPVALAAFGAECSRRLAQSGIPGAHIDEWRIALPAHQKAAA